MKNDLGALGHQVSRPHQGRYLHSYLCEGYLHEWKKIILGKKN